MANKKLSIVALLFFSLFGISFGLNVVAIDNLQAPLSLSQMVESLIQKIFDLLRQIAQTTTDSNQQKQIQQPKTELPLQQARDNEVALLTVNASGIAAYVSINAKAAFVYTEPIILSSGDTYLVYASRENSGSKNISKCGGTASSGGRYICNIKIK